MSLDKPVSSPLGPPNAESPADNDEEDANKEDEQVTLTVHGIPNTVAVVYSTGLTVSQSVWMCQAPFLRLRGALWKVYKSGGGARGDLASARGTQRAAWR